MAFRNIVSCFVCDRRLAPQQMIRIGEEENVFKREVAIRRRDELGRPPAEVNDSTRLCFTCDRSIQNELIAIQQDPTCLKLNVLTQTRNGTCLICNAAANIIRISTECRANVFFSRDIYIPESVRSCRQHLDDHGFILQPLTLGLRFINRPYVIKGPQLQIFLQGLRNVANGLTRLEDESSFTDHEFESFSPVNKQQFREMFSYCDRITRPGGYRYITKKDLLMFLCKIRQGLSDEFLKVMFQYPSRQATSLAVTNVRQSLMQRFVSSNIGLDAITRQNYIDRHITEFANVLYNPETNIPRVIACIDGTYCFIPKSTNFRFLRQSFCIHKGRHLLKPILIVAPNGYILDIQGPYFSDNRNNDAAILENEFERDADRMRGWFREGDIILVDRGYRDATELLGRLGIQWKMPVGLQRGQHQLSTEDANDSRLVTKSRWVVEMRNGHLKSIFKFFQQTMQITHLPHLGDFYRIAGSIINRYHPPIHMEGADAALARILLEKAKEPNVLQALVEIENLNTRNAQRWVCLNSQQVPDFPILTLDYLRELSIGVYQIRLAPSYIQNKLQRQEDEEEFQLEMLTNVDRIPEPGLIRVRSFSRFRNSTKYQLWVSYRPHNIEEFDDAEEDDDDKKIQGYYCTCKSGARTLGACSHIISVLWFMGYARHEQNIRYPSTRLTDVISDAANRRQQVNE